jgi:cation diffusion facilitator CzcD-associated flavoprotein CzcO
MVGLDYAAIGAGPSGLAAARNLQRYGIPWSGYELAQDVADGPPGGVRRGTPVSCFANGTLSEPHVPTFRGSFDGEVLHTSR